MTEVSSLEVTKVLTDSRDAFARLLATYFSANYSGSHFEFFDGRGDNNQSKNVFTYADTFAPNFLSRTVPAHLAYRLVEGDLATKVAAELAKIPVDKSLHEFSENPLKGASLALWKLVIDGGQATVTTSKLLARKRPHLLPVLDSVVKDALRQGDCGRWNHFFTLFSDPELVAAVTEIQRVAVGMEPDFPNIAELSLLRVFDIALWMEHRAAVFGKDHEKTKHRRECLLTYL